MKTGVFFDVDGTLRDMESSLIPESTGRALDRLRRAGYFLGLATGRAIHEVEDEIRALADWDAFVCYNGQTVYTKEDGMILEKTIPANSVKSCLAEAVKTGMPVQIMLANGDTFLTGPADDNVREVYRSFGLELPEQGMYNGETATALMVFGDRGYDYSAYRAISGITVYQGAGPYADISLAGVSKHTGIEVVMARCGLERYIAFGDSFNDLEMLQSAHISVAMGNAYAEVIEIASHRTTTVLDDGIARACEYLGLYGRHIPE